MKNCILIALALSVGACGDLIEDPLYTTVGSACESIVQGRDVTLGPIHSTVEIAEGGCTGTYIAPGVVLTAAHCGNRAYIQVGDVVRSNILYVPHPDFDLSTLTNDLALMFLDGELPIDIATLGVPTYGAALIQGYGMDEFGVSGILREANIFIEAFWAPNSIMAGQGPDSCFGDSGGPMYQAGNLVGVTRSALPVFPQPDDMLDYCGQGGLYTVVAKFREWLDSEVANLTWVGSC